MAWAGIEQRLAAAPANLWRNLRLPGALYYLAAAAFVTSGGGILTGNKFILPALDVLALFPIYFWLRLRRGFQGAVLAILFWSFCKVAAVTFFTVLFPARAAAAVAWGPAYAGGMLAWLGSGADVAGVGAWGTWRLEETLVVAGTSFVTAGLGGLAFATTLLNCQSYYLATLFLRATEPWKVVMLGWPLWEGFRALAFANILLAAAEPTASRLLGRPTRTRDMRDGLILGFLMLAAAYVAQTYLAPWWREALAASLAFDVTP
ncbi:MAG: hypothetical protein GTN49_05375 [candidate division Zixibacteria bacterium]|nr:hypothetical protein [candidate division Zixibacteria bacterium]